MRILLAAALAASLLVACGGGGKQSSRLQTEDVAPPPDASLSTAHDMQAKAVSEGISGVVPGDLPRGLPLYSPSTVVDFGKAGPGKRYLTLVTADAPAKVERSMRADLVAAGWTLSELAAGKVAAAKGGIEVDLQWIDAKPGTRIRIEYPAREG
ncbi:MAG TPA: hypothetical protein VKA53_00630 [Thermoanaerobaculia bacterium]|nr:hypothetical protein [Thermoanaerobaculia bacterium]